MIPQVICVGVITIDTIAAVDNYPHEGQRVIAHEIVRAGGGPAAVAAVTLARLGKSVAIVGTIGDDEDGRAVLKIFKEVGVNTEGISIGADPTAGSVIVASRANNERAISTRQPPVQPQPNQRAQELAKSADWIHVDHVGVTQLGALGISRGTGPKISFDAGYGVKDFDASTVDLFAPNSPALLERNPGMSIEDAVVAEAAKAKNIVAATDGAHGSVGFDTSFVRAAGFEVKISSTLGAGDVFHGALLAQVIESRPLEEALRRANAVAALSCRGLDGQSMIPTQGELEQFLKGA